MDFSIYPFKRYGKYRLYVIFTDQYDNEIRRSTGVTYGLKGTKKNRREARKQAAEKAREIVENYFTADKGSYFETNKNPRLKDFLKFDYWPHVETNCKFTTLVSYKGALNHFIRICKDRPMERYERIDMERYKQQRLQENIRKNTINIEIRSIKAAFSWAWKYDLIERTPYKGQDFLFDVKPNKREFTSKEIQALFKQTRGENIGLVVRLAYYTGMRLGEISAITWNLVHLGEQPYLTIPGQITKTDDPRHIPLGEKAFIVVKALQKKLEEKKKRHPKVFKNRPKAETYLLQKTRGWGQYSKRSIQDMFRKAMNQAGLPKELTFHCLRHSYATHILENGGDIYPVSKLLGHSTVRVTEEFYDHTSPLKFRDTTNLI